MLKLGYDTDLYQHPVLQSFSTHRKTYQTTRHVIHYRITRVTFFQHVTDTNTCTSISSPYFPYPCDLYHISNCSPFHLHHPLANVKVRNISTRTDLEDQPQSMLNSENVYSLSFPPHIHVYQLYKKISKRTSVDTTMKIKIFTPKFLPC